MWLYILKIGVIISHKTDNKMLRYYWNKTECKNDKDKLINNKILQWETETLVTRKV